MKKNIKKKNTRLVWPNGVIEHNGFPFIETPDGNYVQYNGEKVSKTITTKKIYVWPEGIVLKNGFPFIESPDGHYVPYNGKKIAKTVEVEDEDVKIENTEFDNKNGKTIVTFVKTVKDEEAEKQNIELIQEIKRLEKENEKLSKQKPEIVEKEIKVPIAAKAVGSEDEKKINKVSTIRWIFTILFVVAAIALGLIYLFKAMAIVGSVGQKTTAEEFIKIRPLLISAVGALGASFIIAIITTARERYLIGKHFDKIQEKEKEERIKFDCRKKQRNKNKKNKKTK